MEKFGYVHTTKMLVEGRRKVRYMYREKPDNSQDSGWRIFCGDEDDRYANNPDNILIKDINEILEIDPSIQPYLESGIGTVLAREDENAPFDVSHGISGEKERD